VNHENTFPLLSDLLAGAVPEPEAAGAWAHVADCEECRNALTAAHRVRSAIAREGAGIFSEHPSSHDIVRWAQADEELPIAEVARIGNHVRSCETCRREVDLTRRADADTLGEPRERASGWWTSPWRWTDPRLAMVPALAALALLAYPAYRGLVTVRELEHEKATTARDLAAARQQLHARTAVAAAPRAAPEAWAGPVRLLYLPATARGERTTPAVVIREGQRYQPIVAEHRPFEGDSPTGAIEMVILKGDTPVWREQQPVEQVWDASQSSVVVLAPAPLLEAGEYRFEIRRNHVVTYQSAFRVTRKNP